MNLCALPGPGATVRLVEAPLPARRPEGRLLVRMLYAPVNPADLLAISGDYSVQLPSDAPLGAEGVGLVEAVAAGVADIAPGDIVLPLVRGNWSRFRLLGAEDVVRVPPGLDVRQAAMLRINPATALHLLAAAALAPGDWLVQNGAGSAVGHWVRHFAREAAVEVVNVVRHAGTTPLPHQIEDGPDLPARVAALAGEGRVAAALDCVAGEATGRLAECLAPGGRLIAFGHLSGAPCTVRSQLLTGRDLTVKGFSLRPTEARLGAAALTGTFSRIFTAAADPANRLPIRQVVPLTRIADALAAARMPGAGRVLLDLGA